MTRTLGRTNEAFPDVWLRLRLPELGDAESLTQAAAESGLPLDLSAQPGLFGGLLRATSSTLLIRGGAEIDRATDAEHASNLVEAHIIESLCVFGRECLDFYLFTVRDLPKSFQFEGALTILEDARQEGLIRWFGLVVNSDAAAKLWRQYDAFDILVAPEERIPSLTGLASERRVGLVVEEPADVQAAASPKLVSVRSAADVQSLRILTGGLA